jgi:hypothetical protein
MHAAVQVVAGTVAMKEKVLQRCYIHVFVIAIFGIRDGRLFCSESR